MSRKEVMNTHKVKILIRMKNHVIKTGNNEIPLRILSDNVNDYANAQKLRLHALIFKQKRGTWGITSHGWEFLRGTKDLPKFVWVDGNRIQAYSQELVNVRDLNNGEPVIQEVFEYSDGSRRPTTNSLQTSLV